MPLTLSKWLSSKMINVLWDTITKTERWGGGVEKKQVINKGNGNSGKSPCLCVIRIPANERILTEKKFKMWEHSRLEIYVVNINVLIVIIISCSYHNSKHEDIRWLLILSSSN